MEKGQKKDYISFANEFLQREHRFNVRNWRGFKKFFVKFKEVRGTKLQSGRSAERNLGWIGTTKLNDGYTFSAERKTKHEVEYLLAKNFVEKYCPIE